MFLSDLSLSKPVMALMVTLALVIFGLISYKDLGIEDNPNVEFPWITVSTVYPGADPKTVETEITDKIEDEIATLPGIKSIDSTSAENISMIFIEYQLEFDINVAAQDVRDKIARITSSLPDGAETPLVQKLDVMSEPIIQIAVTGDVNSQDLALYVDDTVKPRLESIEGVGTVNVYGTRDREVRIWLDPEKMSARGISVQQLVSAIQQGNAKIPGGRIETGDRELSVITDGEVANVTEFNNIVIAEVNGVIVKLGDVATVEDGYADQRSQARLNGEPAIGLSLVKASGGNTIAIADRAYGVIDELKRIKPPGINLEIVSDNSLYTRDSFNQIYEQVMGGGLLAIIVVLLFLGNIRSTVIAAISIPASIISTMIFIRAFGFTLNNVTMMAFSLMVGLLIDDTIIVVENIYRNLEKGKTPLEAARDGAKEIGFAVIATSLVLVAVFIPLAFMKGIIGRFMFQYGITISFGVLISMVLALFLTPMLSRYLLTSSSSEPMKILAWFDKGYKVIEAGYKWLIRRALHYKGLTLLFALIATVVSVTMFGLTKKEFFPNSDRSATSINIVLPVGSSLESLIQVTGNIENIVKDIPEVELIFSTLGGGTQGNQNEGSIYIDLVDKQKRDRTQFEIDDEIRTLIGTIPGAEITVGGSGMGFGSAYDYNFILRGSDTELLKQTARAVEARFRQSPLFRESDTTLAEGKPEVRVNVNRESAADLGINAAMIGSTLRFLVSGEDQIATYSEGGRSYDVRIRLEAPYRDRPEDLQNLVLFTSAKDASPVPVGAIANVEVTSGEASISHSNKLRSVQVEANLNDGITLGEAINFTETQIAPMLPSGIEMATAGQADIMKESFTSMAFALVLGIALIYMILASQFNHFVHPTTIMMSVPLSFVGAFGLLFIAHMTFNMFSFMGLIMLMGLVTKNAILVVEFTNQLRAKGMSVTEALLTAGPIRLRPILMTTLTTIMGMVPVALMLGGGAGVETRAPMAVAIIGGLTASTLLTLVIVPVVYALFDTFEKWLYRKFKVGEIKD
jgi:hydrophobic/amphiphilic exporter-1 (mainly G- bacteria), HAE1 family